ncbi:hypothetical protein CWI36_1191p0010 [Hamiltosporidium magnivora]|uniref:Leucine-rich repeat-containing protein n=1 Tax=Hamiltosporidium magnivora TaxID=148818 RepID=A0A4Q9L648_9MICR|nr:hypothetical protein CWI36_1191p0010 [Hamiltosporidium magnivora]
MFSEVSIIRPNIVFTKKRQDATHIFYIKGKVFDICRRNIAIVSFIILFLEINHCLRISIDFTNRYSSESDPTNQANSYLSSNSVSRKRNFDAESVDSMQNQFSSSLTKNGIDECLQQEQYNVHVKIPRVDGINQIKELIFTVKSENKINVILESNIFVEIIIRTTPNAHIYMQENNSKEKEKLLRCFLFSYKINGIRISADDYYYTDCKVLGYKFNISNARSCISTIQTTNCSIFNILNAEKKDEIKYIEFERLTLSKEYIECLEKNLCLESLTLVKCVYSDGFGFLDHLLEKFSELKILGIIGFNLSNRFLNNLNLLMLESLDLSQCKYCENIDNCKMQGMKKIEEFRMDNSCINHKVIISILESSTLKILSLKGANVARLRFSMDFRSFGVLFEKFFLSSLSMNLKAVTLVLNNIFPLLHLIEFLNRDSLYISTKKLSLLGNPLSLGLFAVPNKFKDLEYLNISSYKENSFNILSQLSVFEKLESFDLSNCCNLTGGFLGTLSNKALCKSLKTLNITGNKLIFSDILNIRLFQNLVYLIFSFDNKMFYEISKSYQFYKVSDLETLVLTFTNVNTDIFRFIATLFPSIKNIKFQQCNIEEDTLRSIKMKGINFEIY